MPFTVQSMLAPRPMKQSAYVFAVIPLVNGRILAGRELSPMCIGALTSSTKFPSVGNCDGDRECFVFICDRRIASAATFSRIGYPEMKRFGYHKDLLGTVAGQVVSMLIPQRVDDRMGYSYGTVHWPDFAAGVLPGLLLTTLFVIYVFCGPS